MKIGLTLGGGGAKGSYQIGILKAFEELGLIDYIHAISGASIGALNGYFYLSSPNIDHVIKAWEYGTSNNPFEKINPITDGESGKKAISLITEMANKYTDLNIFKRSKTDLYVTLTELESATMLELLKRWSWQKETVHLNKEENPLDYVISSASIPIILGFSEIDDKVYIDGGLTNNNPVDILVEEGCDIIFVSSLDHFYSIDKYKNKDVVLIDLTSKQALPKSLLQSYLAIIDFDQKEFYKRMNYGYTVAKMMISYIIELGILSYKDNKYKFSLKEDHLKRIHIPKEIDDQIKVMRQIDESK